MRKTLLALAAVATLAVSTASPALAWRGGWGPGVAAGLIGGAIIGGAIASSPYYYGPGYAPGYYGPGYTARPMSAAPMAAPATGSASGSGTVMPGGRATCGSAADRLRSLMGNR